MIRPNLFLFVVILFSFCSFMRAEAQDKSTPKFQGAFKDWSVYKRTMGKDVICYALSKPFDKAPKNVRHGDVYFLIASWKSGAALEQPSFLAGYPLRVSVNPEIQVGSDKFSMFVAAHEAFIDSGTDEKKLITAMKRGSVMRLEATSVRGTNTAYQFSLKGVQSALEKVKAVCS